MKLGQPSAELCAPRKSLEVVGISRKNHRLRVICAAQRGQNGSHNTHGVVKVTAGRAGLQRSQAVAAPVREEVSCSSRLLQSTEVLLASTGTYTNTLHSHLPPFNP